MIAFARSTKNEPASVMSRKARGAGPKRDVTCSMVAIATGIELRPKPRNPPDGDGGVVVAAQEREQDEQRDGGGDGHLRSRRW